jgi:hypothetical protein
MEGCAAEVMCAAGEDVHVTSLLEALGVEDEDSPTVVGMQSWHTWTCGMCVVQYMIVCVQMLIAS